MAAPRVCANARRCSLHNNRSTSRTHQTEPEFQCQHCLKKFFTPTSARSHACPKFPGGTGNDSRSGGAPGTRKRRRNPDIERIVDPEEFDRGIKVCTVASTSVAAADGKDKARGAKKEKKQKTSQPPMEKDVSVDRRVEPACAVAASGPESATRSTRNRKAKAKRDENGTARIQTESVAPAAIARGRENTGSATRVIRKIHSCGKPERNGGGTEFLCNGGRYGTDQGKLQVAAVSRRH